MDDPGWKDATALTESQDHASGVASDGSVVVFSTGGSQVAFNSVSSVPLAGGDVSVVSEEPLGGIPSSALTIANGTVYVAVGRSIAAIPIGGGAATELVHDRPGTISSLATDGTRIFWTTGDLNMPDHAEIASATLADGTVTKLTDEEIGHGSYTSAVVDGEGGVFAASPGGVVHVDAAGTVSLVVSDDDASGAVTRIAVDTEHVYGVVAGGRNDLFSVPRDGGEVTQLARQADSTGSILAVSGGVAFFVKDDVRWVPSGGGDAVTLATGKYPDGTIALAGNRLVFPADWRIWSVPLPQ